ncbi:terpene cyclase/mutase family protein [Streptomyces thermolineatus]|uniref:Terpene cyclase/mutase family protein n=2 Tax=Streptomyces thermolineatus TaxID=44033 RepID=A0ABP5ZIG0_9ACTN
MSIMFTATVRRSAAVLAAGVVLCTAAAPVAAASPAASASPSPELPAGLYGKADPAYDGVWRQSLALLALDTAGVTPADEAVDWLTGQQCEDGGFASYRADTGVKCDPKTQDTNATAIAVQALAALGGESATVDRAVDWLKEAQNKDGGWPYNPGNPSDANSTSVVIGALDASGQKVADVRKGSKSPYDALLSFQLGCDADEKDGRGAFAYQPDAEGGLVANDNATAAAALASLGSGHAVPAPKGDRPVEAPKCSGGDAEGFGSAEDAAEAAAAYLVSRLEADGQHLSALQPGADKPAPDHGTTADAVLALAAGGHLEAAKAPAAWLGKNSSEWAKDQPAALGKLVLTAAATGGDASAHVEQLTALGPEPKAASEDAGKGDGQQEEAEDSSGSTLWWIIGAGLLVGLVAGVVISLRGRNNK